MHHMENWDDLRVFLATARAGSSRASGKALGINQSTVSRRVRRLEERSAARLFDRRSHGLVLTEAGEELLDLASDVEERIAALHRRLHGRDSHLAGPLRLSMPDLMVAPCAPHLARFANLYPQIEVEVIVDNGFANLTRREADLALRIASDPPVQLVGRRISRVMCAIYGAVAYTDAMSLPIDPSAVNWVRWDESWRTLPWERWIDAHVAPEQVRARVNTSLAHGELLAAGVGVGLALCCTGDVDPRLRRASTTIDFGLYLWLLAHEDLKRTARIRALLRFLGDALTAERPLFLVDSV
jgi:DNA-binding transcriptional LysR family regulator